MVRKTVSWFDIIVDWNLDLRVKNIFNMTEAITQEIVNQNIG